jgi:glycosyltransferase involved in cell wall biosynthesis
MNSCDDKIDVCIPTWNSSKTLELCLKSILREVPVKDIRIVDNFSDDATLSIAKNFKAIIVQRKCGIGEARQYLIEHVTTDYFAFVDSDAVLRRGWFESVMNKMKSNEKIGEVCGLWFSDNPQDRHFWEVCWKRIPPDHPMWSRGYLIDTLIKTEAIKGIQIPKEMNNYEDKFVRDYVISKGYHWAVAKDAFCDHLLGELSFWKTCIGRKYYGAGLREWKDADTNASAKKLVLNAPIDLAKASAISIKARDPIIIPFKLFSELFTIRGYFGAGTGQLLKEIEKNSDYKRQYSKFKKSKRC